MVFWLPQQPDRIPGKSDFDSYLSNYKNYDTLFNFLCEASNGCQGNTA